MPNKAFFNVLRITAKCLGEQDSENGSAHGSAHGSRTRWRELCRSPCRAWGHPFQVRLGFRLSSKISKVNRTISKTQPSTKVGIYLCLFFSLYNPESFSCEGQDYGYYADKQVIHISKSFNGSSMELCYIKVCLPFSCYRRSLPVGDLSWGP